MIINDEPTIPEGWDRIVFAEDQPEYATLPAAVSKSPYVVVMSEWIPDVEDLHKIMNGGKIRIRQMTFGEPLQPVHVEVID